MSTKDLNRVELIGNMGQDPEIRSLNNGGSVAELNLATNKSYKDKNTDEWAVNTQWHRVVIFNKYLLEKLKKFIEDGKLKKGTRVSVTGSLQTRSWEDSSGNKRYITEILVSHDNGHDFNLTERSRTDAGEEPKMGTSSYTPDDLDDEIPF